MRTNRLIWVGLTAVLLLFSPPGAQAQLDKDEQKCVDKMNNDGRKVLDKAAKADRKCINLQSKNGGGNATACVDGSDPKTEKAKGKLSADYQKKCVDNLPAFGLAAGGDTAVNAAAEGAANALVHDLFGIDVIVGTAKEEAKCQDKVAQRAGQLAVAKWKEFRKCKKNGLKGKDGPPFTSATELATACLGGPTGPQPDPKGKVAKKEAKIDADVQKQCIGKGVTPVAAQFPGECAGESDQDFHTCVIRQVNCRVCEALSAADELSSSDIDCDLFDDSLDNESCVGVQAHKCTFDGATDNSQLQICFLGVCPPASEISGALDITCDPDSEDINGKRNCQCALQAIDPFLLTGVGTVCIEPAPGCPPGELECDGGNSLAVDIVGDHDIPPGTCLSNADCSASCDTYCAGIGKTQFTSGCESFCQGGARADLPCECDTLGAATCSGGSTLDCPGGSCEGKDNEVDVDCHCTCIDEAFGGPSAAGDISCRVGVAIRVEADPICDNSQVLVRLPTQCAPFTSTTSTGVILQTNETAGMEGPYSESGAAGSCANFDTSVTSGYELVSVLAFYDSTIGDLVSRLRLDCQ